MKNGKSEFLLVNSSMTAKISKSRKKESGKGHFQKFSNAWPSGALKLAPLSTEKQIFFLPKYPKLPETPL